MVIIVTGGRDNDDVEYICESLENLHLHNQPITKLIHGGAKGTDAIAGLWAEQKGIDVIVCPADWNKHGLAAGPIRNKEMLKYNPDYVVAFKGGKGTDNMIYNAINAGYQVIYL